VEIETMPMHRSDIAEEEHEMTFKKHHISISRPSEDKNWYIIVTAPNGCYAYDGWWRDSEFKTPKEAFEEAKRGALITKK
jgi:predicted RNase H-like HicB family nuclease